MNDEYCEEINSYPTPYLVLSYNHFSASPRDSWRWWIDFIFGLVCGVILWVLSEEIKQPLENAGSMFINGFEIVIEWLNSYPG